MMKQRITVSLQSSSQAMSSSSPQAWRALCVSCMDDAASFSNQGGAAGEPSKMTCSDPMPVAAILVSGAGKLKGDSGADWRSAY